MNKKQKRTLQRILLAAALLVVLQFLPAPRLLRFFLYLIPYGIIGHDILKKAWKGILNRQVFDENFLMAIATVGAFVLALTSTGDYVEAVAVMLFYQVGELFQSVAVGKSRRSIAALVDIRPDIANLVTDEGIIEVDPSEVGIGSVILVNPGERIPIDGVIVDGSTTVDTCAVTGESLPRDGAPGDEVFSGCVNLTGAVRIRTTKEFGESTVARILDMVENASTRKSRQESFITRFAKFYTPFVVFAAVIVAFLPPLILGQSFTMWIGRALIFLVISCPCALVISVPLSFFGGIGAASNHGILVKGSNYLEAIAKADTIVFDKTGTLTKGVFAVNEIVTDDEISEDELLSLAAYAESYSNHPIGISIKEEFEKRGGVIDNEKIKNSNEIAGKGIELTLIGGNIVYVGNKKLLSDMGVKPVEKKPNSYGTVVYVAKKEKCLGFITISDTVKEDAKAAIERLKSQGITNAVMLTGDRKETADAVSGELGIDTVYSELLPADKVEKVEELIAQKGAGEVLAFVGDGINDAPVLSRADVGIAMGALGSDAAIEAADVVLMDDDPLKIVKAVKIASKCMRIVYENIYFAIGVKVLCLVLGAFGLAGMWAAIFADVGVMILAVLNAIRALFVKRL